MEAEEREGGPRWTPDVEPQAEPVAGGSFLYERARLELSVWPGREGDFVDPHDGMVDKPDARRVGFEEADATPALSLRAVSMRGHSSSLDDSDSRSPPLVSRVPSFFCGFFVRTPGPSPLGFRFPCSSTVADFSGRALSFRSPSRRETALAGGRLLVEALVEAYMLPGCSKDESAGEHPERGKGRKGLTATSR